MKITVCKGCKQVMATVNPKTGKPSCIVCHGFENNSIPVEVEIADHLVCAYHCGSDANLEGDRWRVHLSKKGGWNAIDGQDSLVDDLPFIDSKDKTFYCGCYGWD